MEKEHSLIKYSENHTFDNFADPISKSSFRLGEDAVVCQKKNSLISPLSLKSNDYECPFCREKLRPDLTTIEAATLYDKKEKTQPKLSLGPPHVRSESNPILWTSILVVLTFCFILTASSAFVLIIGTGGTESPKPSNTRVRLTSTVVSTVPTSFSHLLTPLNTPSVLKIVPSNTALPIITGCSDAPPQRVEVGRRGFVCTQYDRLIVRTGPRKSEDEITRLVPGTYFRVIDGPVCANNWSWWEIRTDDGVKGWVSEGGDNIDRYFICPQNLSP